jgi:cytidine deaminase
MAGLDDLRAAAEGARKMNWAPYSRFVVLAAVETIDGRVYGGSNVENVNFTLTKHAEETAVIAALADGALVRCGRQWLKTIYVQSSADSGPCGGCRQFINEFAADDALWVKHDTTNDTTTSRPFRDLLPFDFGPRHLGQ